MTKNQKSGFTIIEVTVASFLLIILTAGVLGLQYILGNAQVQSINSFLSVESGNGAINQMARTLRKVRPGENGNYALVSLDDNFLEFYSDIDLDDKAEKITYSLDGANLIQSTVEPTGNPAVYNDLTATTKIIATEVQNATSNTPVFFYYNGDWPQDTANNPMATPADLLETKAIRIALITNTSNDENKEFLLETIINLRTLKNNL